MENLEETTTQGSGTGLHAPGAEAELPEFDEFLAQIGYGHMYRFSADAPPAETESRVEPAPQPETYTPTATVTVHRLSHGAIGLLLALGTVAMIGSVVWQPLHDALHRARIEREQAKAAALVDSPFFSLERFDSVQPGVREEHLRNLLGLPIVRRPRFIEGAREDWCYAAPSGETGKGILVCMVSMEAGKVARTKKFFANDTASFGAAWPGQLASHPGKRLRLDWSDGSREIVGEDDAVPSVFLCSVIGVDARDLEGLPARVCAAHCAVDNDTVNGGRRATVFGTDPKTPLALPPLSLYWKGTLYSLPFNMPGVSKETVRADLKWLLAHLSVLQRRA